jgi:hypothetical protein
MWDLLRPRTKSQDVMVQSQQNTVIKASCNIVKQLDKLETMKETVEIDEIHRLRGLLFQSLYHDHTDGLSLFSCQLYSHSEFLEHFLLHHLHKEILSKVEMVYINGDIENQDQAYDFLE